MTDPFDVLRDPGRPVDPDPAFAARLRARLERAIVLPRVRPRGVVPVTAVETPAVRPAAVPYLAVADARAAMDWYVDVFGAEAAGEPIVMPDGRIGHAELMLAGGVVYLADAHPEIGVTAPRPGESSVSLMLPVADADEVRARALAAGASGDREPYDGYGQRNAWVVDPFGHRWGLYSPLPVASEPRAGSEPRYAHGDVGYVSLWTPDATRASRFYGAVLGWSISDDGFVAGATPTTSIRESTDRADLFCCYAVDDVAVAVERVRAAGGQAAEPESRPYGLISDCTDDQGTPFALYEQPAGHAGNRPPANGRNDGDLSYLTVCVVDSARARAFYGAVLAWRFEPGRVEDGWQVLDTVPMVGLSGGHTTNQAVPMWRVPDVERAVAAVRANGGRATDPRQQPYGVTSECIDDQGTAFYLGEM